jgi:serine protease Do
MKKRIGYFSLSLVIVASVLFGMVIASSFNKTPAAESTEAQSTVAQAKADPQPEQMPEIRLPSFADIAERANPAVVKIDSTSIVKRQVEQPPFFNPFDWFFPPNDRYHRYRGEGEEEIPRQSGGTGFIISTDGEILTNNHVVDKADKIEVVLSNDKTYKAKVLGADPETDIALIKIDAPDPLPTIPLGDSDKLRVGDWVMAIGNPYGYAHSVTVGVVSAKGRRLTSSSFDDFIQTDAAINFGNSGGPLVNVRGEAVGINTAISVSGQNIGFAIPINLAKNILSQLKEGGRVIRGFLGIRISNITDELQQAFQLPSKEGVLVQSAEEGYPGAEAGLKPGDVILEVDGKKMNSSDQLVGTVSAKRPGEEVQIEILRDGVKKTVTAKLSERPSGEEEEGPSRQEETKPGKVGISVQNITTDVRRYYRLPSDLVGVIITDVKPTGPAAAAGLQEGDVITEINRQKVKNVAEYEKAVESAKGDIVLVYVVRGDNSFFVTIKIED